MIQISSYYKRALELHQSVPVVDTHNDLAGEILIRHSLGEQHVIKSRYLPNWKAANFKLIVSSIYIENHVFYPANATSKASTEWPNYYSCNKLCYQQGFQNALDQIQALKKEIEECSDELILITSSKDFSIISSTNKIGILMYMEGLDCIGQDLSKLDLLYQLGVRGASLTWSRQNLIATGCCTATHFEDIPGSITCFGQQVLTRMNELGMFLDISHLNNEGFQQLFTLLLPCLNFQHPIIATHSNAYEVHANYRNLTDSQLRVLANQGGILGLNACKYIVGESGDYLDSMCMHIEYIVNLLGASHVGYGFDLCDSYELAKRYDNTTNFEPEDCLANHKEALLLTARLIERGMAEEKVLQIIGLNWWSYFQSVVK